MLYQLYELNYAAAAPLRMMAQSIQAALKNPFMPGRSSEFAMLLGAAAEMTERGTRRFAKPPFNLPTTTIGGKTVTVTEEIALEKPFCQLRHFSRDTNRDDPTVLVVAPLSGHHATLLRGTVQALLPHHNVYITDWKDARRVPLAAGPFSLDDYVDYVIEFLRFLGPNVHIVAVCQPSVPVMAAVALLAEDDDPVQPLSMTLMGGPIDTRAASTAVTKVAEKHPISWFERTVVCTVPMFYPGAMRRVYPGFLQLTGFMQMNLERHVDAHMKLFNHLIKGDGESADATKRFYDEYMAVLDLPSEFYLQTVETVFQKHLLPKGEMYVHGRRVDTTKIRKTALLTVEGELDDISAPGQTLAAHALCPNLPPDMKQASFQHGVGHYGIFNGRRWRDTIMPTVRSWMRHFDPERTQVPAMDLNPAKPAVKTAAKPVQGSKAA